MNCGLACKTLYCSRGCRNKQVLPRKSKSSAVCLPDLNSGSGDGGRCWVLRYTSISLVCNVLMFGALDMALLRPSVDFRPSLLDLFWKFWNGTMFPHIRSQCDLQYGAHQHNATQTPSLPVESRKCPLILRWDIDRGCRLERHEVVLDLLSLAD